MCLVWMNTVQQPPRGASLSLQSEIAVVSNDTLATDTTFFRREHQEVNFNLTASQKKNSIFLFSQLVFQQFLLRTGKIKGCEQWIT